MMAQTGPHEATENANCATRFMLVASNQVTLLLAEPPTAVMMSLESVVSIG